MGTCLSDVTIKDDDLVRVNPRFATAHKVVNPIATVQMTITSNDPLIASEQLMQVKFDYNGIPPLNPVERKQKTDLIGINARTKLRVHGEAGGEEKEEVMDVVEFDS